jgi:zinc protease
MTPTPIHRTQLFNGIKILTIENQAADIVAGRIFFPAGSRWETAEESGLAHLMATLLTKGTDRLTAMDIADRVESIGAGLGADTTTDYFQVSLKTVSRDLPEILELAAQILRHPAFPQEQLELERKLTIQAIRSQTEQPFNNAYHQLRQMMYGDRPYGFSPLGTEETVAAISRDRLLAYHHQHLRPDRMVISLAGRITPDLARELVERVFGDWQPPTAAPPTLAISEPPINPQAYRMRQATQQAIVMLGYLAPPISDADAIPLKAIDSYLGGGMSSRLFVELREKRGLAYEIASFYPTKIDRSHFVAYMGTAASNDLLAVNGLRAEIERLCIMSIDDEDLENTKSKLIGQYALSKQTNGQLAQTAGWYELLGLNLDFDRQFCDRVEKLTTNDLQSVADKYLSEPYISIVAPE